MPTTSPSRFFWPVLIALGVAIGATLILAIMVRGI